MGAQLTGQHHHKPRSPSLRMSERKHRLQRFPKVATALSGRGALAASTVFLVRSRFVAWLGKSPLPKDSLSRTACKYRAAACNVTDYSSTRNDATQNSLASLYANCCVCFVFA